MGGKCVLEEENIKPYCMYMYVCVCLCVAAFSLYSEN